MNNSEAAERAYTAAVCDNATAALDRANAEMDRRVTELRDEWYRPAFPISRQRPRRPAGSARKHISNGCAHSLAMTPPKTLQRPAGMFLP